jgi:hypothetical protein
MQKFVKDDNGGLELMAVSEVFSSDMIPANKKTDEYLISNWLSNARTT